MLDRQNEVVYSHKVGDIPLSAISIQGNSQGGGRLTAVGDANGMISLMEVSEGLAMSQSNEKAAISGMFERETKREKNLEMRLKEQKRKTTQSSANNGHADIEGESTTSSSKDDKMEELLRQVDANFLGMIKEAEDSENKSLEHKANQDHHAGVEH